MNEGEVPESEIFKALDKLCGMVAENILREQSAYDELRRTWPDEVNGPEPPPQIYNADRCRTTISNLGRIVSTRAALAAIREAGQDAREFLTRHQRLEQGVLGEDDYALNILAAQSGDDRILSAYMTTLDVKLWIITESDRSATTILLPEEY